MNLKKILLHNKHELILTLLVCIYIFYFTLATFLRYENFYTGRFDLGHMAQTVWNTSEGRIFQISNSHVGGIMSRLGAHADFILILLAPFYFLWSDPRMLTFILTIVLACGAFFIYAITKNVLKNKNLSLIFASAYLMYPAVQYNNLYDFHAVSLATTFFLGSFYFILKKNYTWVTVFLLLAAITKEQVWAITALFGGFIFFKNQSAGGRTKKILGITIFIISVLAFYVLIWHAIPASRGNQEHFALAYYADYGESPTEVVKNLILLPDKIIETILQRERLNYLKQLFGPLGFLSIFSPFYLIFTLPGLAINLLSNNPNLHQIYYQYSSTITPFIFISAIYGIKNLTKWFPKIPTSFLYIYIVSALLISSYIIGPMPFSKKPNIAMLTNPQPNKEIINNYLRNISENYSISSTNNIGSHLSHRQLIFNIPTNMDSADMVLFLINGSLSDPSFKDQRQWIEDMKQNKNYFEDFRKDGFIVFKKNKFCCNM